METLYVWIGIIGSFVFGFLIGLFFGIGKFKRGYKSEKIEETIISEIGQSKDLNNQNHL